MSCPDIIASLAKSLISNEKGSPDSALNVCSIQKDPFDAILLIQKDGYSEPLQVQGKIISCWVVDKNTIRQSRYIKQEFSSGISSPMPHLYFAITDTNSFLINYICGPRAARGFKAVIKNKHGHDYLEVDNKSPTWIS